jgi:predicted RNA-binding protein with TRAM domain
MGFRVTSTGIVITVERELVLEEGAWDVRGERGGMDIREGELREVRVVNVGGQSDGSREVSCWGFRCHRRGHWGFRREELAQLSGVESELRGDLSDSDEWGERRGRKTDPWQVITTAALVVYEVVGLDTITSYFPVRGEVMTTCSCGLMASIWL